MSSALIQPICSNDQTNSIRAVVRRIGSVQFAATLEARIAAPLLSVFDFIVAEDVLPKVLTGYGLLPAVVRSSGNTGPWDQPGSARTVHLADGSTAREQVTAYERPVYFAYARAALSGSVATHSLPEALNSARTVSIVATIVLTGALKNSRRWLTRYFSSRRCASAST